ncbi:MAG: restriction endonuclease subunit S [Finegoldia magna]|uniref:restriction endonuclease subunit S n=1 Tax=Finegoldia magna TaxID=1260 RepID=UPI0029034BD0|nr:restriction endonuclease subunit S [Finegoldia magna]MDU2639127.1 restriction endonuclease subunit S [Finegoldia magna]
MLNEKLENVEWGEYKIGDLFEVSTSKGYDAGKMKFLDRNDFTYEFIGRTRDNYGLQGFVEKLDTQPNNENTISVSQVGAVHAQLRKNKWYSSQNMFILTTNNNSMLNLFVVASIDRVLNKYSGYSSYPTLAKLREHKIKLPTKDGKINFDFMDSFIAELESQCVAELDAYLNVTGLKDYKLIDVEINAIDYLKKVKWQEFKMGDLFEKVKTKKLPYKAKELPKEPTGNYNLPLLTSSFMNQGLNYFAPKTSATILENVISIPSNSDVYRSYYQSREFSVLSDAYAIEWKYENIELSSNVYLFLVSCINKVTDLSIYSYKNKLGGWNVVKNKYIKLPVDKNGDIDFIFMENITQAIKKLVIKDVSIYSDKKLEVVKDVSKYKK